MERATSGNRCQESHTNSSQFSGQQRNPQNTHQDDQYFLGNSQNNKNAYGRQLAACSVLLDKLVPPCPPPMLQDPWIVAGYGLPKMVGFCKRHQLSIQPSKMIFDQIKIEGKMENYHKLTRILQQTSEFPYRHGDQNIEMLFQNFRMNAHMTLPKEPRTNLAKATAIH